MPAEQKHVLTLTIPLRRGDIDGAGHVNNTNYFRFMEEARVAWYETMDLAGNFDPAVTSARAAELLPPYCGPIVVTASCTFMKALKFPGDALVDVLVSEPGRTSVLITYRFRASYAPDTLFAEGASKALWIDMKKEKSIPLPAPVRALFDT